MKYLILACLALSTSVLAKSADNEEQALIEQLRKRTEAGSASILFWNAKERRVGFREMEKIAPTRTIHKGTSVYPLKNKPTNLATLSYEFEGKPRTVQDFLNRPETIGLIVIHKDNVLFENYQTGNDASSRWISFSVTKSVTSLLIGAAIKDGYIKSVDEPVVHYLPRLRGTAYEKATIKDVLQMSSGVAWNEDYADPNSDVAKAGAANGLRLVEYLGNLEVKAKPGEVWNYNTGETNLAGQILRAAIGNNAANYLTRKIWQPFGMEYDANWMLSAPYGDETGGCCINATLRDYARLGIFAMKNGVLADGTAILPDDWMKDSTTPAVGYKGYGYLWWLHGDGTYSARGIFGQNIYIDPENELVIAMHNSAPAAVDTDVHRELGLVWAAIAQHLRR